MLDIKEIFTNILTKLKSHDTSISNLNTTVSGHTTSISSLNSTVSGHTTTLSNHTTSISNLNTTVSGHTTTISNHTSQISSLQGHTNNVKLMYGTSTVRVKDGGTTAVETLIPYNTITNIKNVVTADNIIGVEVWLGALRLPYINNGNVQTWVNMDWKSGNISILNKTKGWNSNSYVPKILLFYV